MALSNANREEIRVSYIAMDSLLRSMMENNG